MQLPGDLQDRLLPIATDGYLRVEIGPIRRRPELPALVVRLLVEAVVGVGVRTGDRAPAALLAHKRANDSAARLAHDEAVVAVLEDITAAVGADLDRLAGRPGRHRIRSGKHEVQMVVFPGDEIARPLVVHPRDDQRRP